MRGSKSRTELINENKQLKEENKELAGLIMQYRSVVKTLDERLKIKSAGG